MVVYKLAPMYVTIYCIKLLPVLKTAIKRSTSKANFLPLISLIKFIMINPNNDPIDNDDCIILRLY